MLISDSAICCTCNITLSAFNSDAGYSSNSHHTSRAVIDDILSQVSQSAVDWCSHCCCSFSWSNNSFHWLFNNSWISVTFATSKQWS